VGFFVHTLLFFWRYINIRDKSPQINEEIKDKEVRLIGNDGHQFGVVTLKEALSVAEECGLDLVKISPNATPPVCKIMNYGKYKFERMKKEKESKKNRKGNALKEIRLSVSIDVHDFETKVRNAKKFIDSGSKVKVSLRFKGREIGHKDLGKKMLEDFSKACEDFASTEKAAKLEGKSMIMFLCPKLKTSSKN